MNGKSVGLVGLAALGALVIYFNFRGEAEGNLVSPQIAGESERTPSTAPQWVDGEAIARGERTGRELVEQPPDLDVEQWSWLPPEPELELGGMSGADVLSSYWGDEWPAIEAHFANFPTVERMLGEWVGLEGTELESRSEFMEGIAELVVRAFRSSKRKGVSLQLWASLGGLNRNAPDMLHHFVTAIVVERSLELQLNVTSEQVRDAVATIKDRHQDSIQASIDEAIERAKLSDDLIEVFIARDLEDVSKVHGPKEGTLFVCPITSVVHPEHLGLSLQQVVVVSATGEGFWCANYSVLVDAIPGLTGNIQSIDGVLENVTSWVEALADIELGGE